MASFFLLFSWRSTKVGVQLLILLLKYHLLLLDVVSFERPSEAFWQEPHFHDLVDKRKYAAQHPFWAVNYFWSNDILCNFPCLAPDQNDLQNNENSFSLKAYQICVLFETKVASVLYCWEHNKTPSAVHFFMYFCSLIQNNTQAEIMTLCRLWRSLECWSDVGDRLLITNVSTMLGNNWPNLIPTVEKVIYWQWMYKVYPVSIHPR